MNQHPTADSASSDFERQLAGLSPQPPRLNRDGLMFQAGHEAALRQMGLRDSNSSALAPHAHVLSGSERRRAWLWPAMSGVLAVAASVLAVLLAIGREPRVEREVVYVDRPAVTGSAAIVQSEQGTEKSSEQTTRSPRPNPAARELWTSRQSQGLFHARDLVLALGVDALPAGGQLIGVQRVGDQSLASLRAELSGDARPQAEAPAESGDWLPQVLSWPLGM